MIARVSDAAAPLDRRTIATILRVLRARRHAIRAENGWRPTLQGDGRLAEVRRAIRLVRLVVGDRPR